MNTGALSQKILTGFFLLGLLFSSPALFSADLPAADPAADPPSAGRGNYLTLKIAVMGPGDELYFWWGHIGLVIEDALSGQDGFYDWGVFSFDRENFFLNFALGRLFYSCALSIPARLTYENYIRTNRDITVYTLNLPPEVKETIFRFAEHNILPENRDYLYHHFRDNCATRIRDIIDMAALGAFKRRYENAPGRFTLREHVRRHTWFSPFWDWSLNFWMGREIDKPISIWDEMFLPSEIGRRILDFTYLDSSGIERALVSSVEVLNISRDRPGVLEAPKPAWPRGLLGGLVLALAAALLQIPGRKRGSPGKIFGIYQALLGLFFGAAGLILFFMMFFTDHDYTFGNINILFVNPLVLAALPLGIICGTSGSEEKRLRALRFLRVLWTCVFLGALAAGGINILWGFHQQNQMTLALILPLAFVLSVFPRRLASIRRMWKTGRSGGR
ncbi:MAG: DUF4105 domain-containing protein [Spirochaetaceae bacterium]|jgi:hypothetical protein|nr:DUF4105 domain-containing protein [Spirochaetaceae bacterium]